MSTPSDPDHLETSLRRFRDFFTELSHTFVERETVLTQFALALLSRQHVLMTGPPGTAKSQMASMVLGRIVDESTRKASLFARQFTENTVQTDLIGPINFKTLMESGRTEHFTDEGMLGSVHAFLDEVFDGRDMLLRSTLNILHEREVKQGGVIAKGRIECAFMTSNRYIAEILDTARQTLLAFIDRISFISFIPRSFAQPDSLRAVVRRHGGGFGNHKPNAYLSIQDLDVLQAAADMTYVPEEICDAVAQLVTLLDAELAQAQRADPEFQPTRYLSTRTAVQATRVLRAIVVYDKIFHRAGRPLQAAHTDLQMLRYFLLLSGVARSSLTEIVSIETDPRERRQLDIMATEAEIFDRVLAKIPIVETPLQPRRVQMNHLKRLAEQARHSDDPAALEKAVHQLLDATESGATDAADAARLLVDTVGELSGRALRGGLTPPLHGKGGLYAMLPQLAEITTSLERTAGQGRPLANWLRGRLLDLLDAALNMSVCPTAGTVEVLGTDAGIEALDAQIDERFREAEGLLRLREQLAGGHVGARAEDEGAVQTALERLEDELVLLWDAKFRHAALQLLANDKGAPLVQVLEALSPVLDALRRDADRYHRTGRESALVRRVTGPRLEPVVGRAFLSLDGKDRGEAVTQVEAVVGHLRRAGLGEMITPDRFVAWTAPVLLRDDAAPVPGPVADRAQYDRARAAEPQMSITDTLLRVAVAAIPPDEHAGSAEDPADHVRETLRALDDGPKARVIDLDLSRVERNVARLESWWKSLTDAAKDGDAPRDVAVLEAVVQSGFLRAVRGDAEPLRVVTEIDHLSEVFPEGQERGAQLRQRLVELDKRSTQMLVGLLQRKADAAWASALE